MLKNWISCDRQNNSGERFISESPHLLLELLHYRFEERSIRIDFYAVVNLTSELNFRKKVDLYTILSTSFQIIFLFSLDFNMKASVRLETSTSLFASGHFDIHICCMFLHVSRLWNCLWNRSFHFHHFSDQRFEKRIEKIYKQNGEKQIKSITNIKISLGFRSTLFDDKTVKYRHGKEKLT